MMIPPDHIITTTAKTAMQIAADRELGHRMVMRLWDRTRGRRPRADLGILWSVNNLDIVTGTGTVLVRSNTPPTKSPQWVRQAASVESRPGAAGQHVRFRIDLAALRTPMVPLEEDVRRTLKAGADRSPRPAGQGLCYRANPVPVPPEALEDWVSSKLSRNGLTVERAAVLAYRTIVLQGHRCRYPAATVKITGSVADEGAWRHAVTSGIGKGKAFGFGTVLFETKGE